MTQDRAPIRMIATLAFSLLAGLAGFGCATDGVAENPSPEASPETVGAPDQLPDSTLAQACTSTIAPSGLVCTSCGRGSQRTRECLPAQCTVTERGCLRCTDPKDRVAVDCHTDLADGLAGVLGVGPDDVFSFASCTLNWGAPAISGTSCHFPVAESCVVNEGEGIHSLSCTYRDGSSRTSTSDSSVPLADPLIGRPDDLPAPGACIDTPVSIRWTARGSRP
jgi:hypothetical protein